MKYFFELESPIGTIFLAKARDALSAVTLDGQRRPDIAEMRCDARAFTDETRQLREYFAGKRTRFDVALATKGTPFQREVWRALVEIPFGHTTSYGAIARALGRPQAFRAVGLANAHNPIALFVPCHRVIGSSGALVGYASGIERKRWLLDHEKKMITSDDTR